MPDYISERRDRLECSKGSLMTFIESDLEYSIIDNPTESTVECICIKLIRKEGDIIVTNFIYIYI